MKNEKQKIGGNDACVLMHTALRKLADSPATSAFYNAVQILPEIKPRALNPWLILGEMVADALDENPGWEVSHIAGFLDGASSHRVGRLEKVFFERLTEHRRAGKNEPAHATSALYLLLSLFRLFKPSDFAAMAGYLKED